MVLVAPRSAKLVESRGARFTLLAGYVFCLLGFLTMLLLWKEGSPVLEGRRSPTPSIGIGVGFAGTPASHSLTGSVPVQRAGMASGTADLQRDLGGAIMQSIFGALLTAGYARAASSGHRRLGQEHLPSVQNQLTKSFAGAEPMAAQYPQYASAITAAAKSSFLHGDQWAYIAGIVAVAVGAGLVFFCFPSHDRERELLEQYQREDTADAVSEPRDPTHP